MVKHLVHPHTDLDEPVKFGPNGRDEPSGPGLDQNAKGSSHPKPLFTGNGPPLLIIKDHQSRSYRQCKCYSRMFAGTKLGRRFLQHRVRSVPKEKGLALQLGPNLFCVLPGFGVYLSHHGRRNSNLTVERTWQLEPSNLGEQNQRAGIPNDAQECLALNLASEISCFSSSGE